LLAAKDKWCAGSGPHTRTKWRPDTHIVSIADQAGARTQLACSLDLVFVRLQYCRSLFESPRLNAHSASPLLCLRSCPLAYNIFAIHHPPPPHCPTILILISVLLSFPLALCAIFIAERNRYWQGQEHPAFPKSGRILWPPLSQHDLSTAVGIVQVRTTKKTQAHPTGKDSSWNKCSSYR